MGHTGGRWYRRRVADTMVVKYRTAVLLLAALALVSAQITFSRDWTGGKRSEPQLAVDCAQFSRLCRHFVNELRQAMSPGRAGSGRRPPSAPDDPSPTYDDDN